MRGVPHIRITAILIAAASALGAPAAASELPKRQPGLWETSAVIGGRYRVMRRCFKPGEQSVFVKTVGAEACTRSVQRTLAGHLMQVDCRFRGALLMGRVQITGDFDGDLRGRVRTMVKDDDGDGPPRRATMTFTSRRVGECGQG
jgi:hypothetical protein